MIEKIFIEPGCISCRNCESIAPDIFKVAPKSKVISDVFDGKTTQIIQAELLCPVNVIKVKKTGNISISLQNAKLIEKKYLTNDVVELVFYTQNFKAKPGQYISLQMMDWKGVFYRNYSLTGYDTNTFTLTIKLLSDGRGSNFIKNLKLNKKIKYLGGLGSFVLQNTTRKKVFFATNTGLSPVISMLQCLPKNIEKHVYFGVRNSQDIFYKQLILSFKNTKLDILLSGTEEKNNGYTSGRITQKVEEIEKESEVYICGNPNMMDEVIEKLLKQGHPKELIFSEGFVMGKEERSVRKNILLKGTIPGIHYIDTYLPIIGIIGIPVLYYYGIENNVLHKSGFIGYHSISSFLFLLSWYTVVFVMMIRPLADLVPKLGILRKLSTLRKAFGIVGSMVIVTIFFDKYFVNYGNFAQYFSVGNWNSYYPILSRLTELTGVLLLITSNHFSQQKLGKYWKLIQRSSYVYFISGGLVAAQWGSVSYYYIIWIWALLYISAGIKNRFFTK